MGCSRWRFSKSMIAAGVLGLAVSLLAGLSVLMFGQEAERSITIGNVRITGVPEDWTHHHLVFSNPGTENEALDKGTYDEWLRIVNDPRYIIHQLKRGLPAQGPAAEDVARIEEMARAGKTAGAREATPGLRTIESQIATEAAETPSATIGLKPMPVVPAVNAKTKKITKDWNESLGSTTAPSYASYPAKWAFSPTTASCANDFVIYPTGQAGAANRASIIAYYNLYTTGCSGTVPMVDWAYNTGGTLALAPVFSLSGSQIVFVQTTSSVASLVLLSYPITPPGTGTLTSPIAPASKTPAAYPGCTAPCMTSITFNGSPNDTLSSPYYDYSTDSLYVGDSVGKLHKFKPVFNGTPAEVVGSGWPLALNSSYAPTSPVYDGNSACVFVGDTGGYLYSVESGNSGSVCTSATASKHGTSSQLDVTYGLRDAPLVDSTAERVYAFVGDDSSGNDGVFQFPATFTSGSGTEATLGTGATGTTAYQLDGTFDNTYYSSSNSSSPSGNIYVCGTTAGAPLYQVAISSNVMGTVTTGPMVSDSSLYYGRCSPVTEFYNTSAGVITATGTVTIASNPASWSFSPTAPTVTIGSTTYTFVNAAPTSANQVEAVTSHISGTTNEDDTAINLTAAIMANASCNAPTGSGCYGSGTVANASVTATRSGAVVSLTAKTSGAGGDFTLTTSNTGDLTVSGGQNGVSGTDYIFMSVFYGTQSGCTQGTTDGCVMSFNVTTPSNFSGSLTALGTLNVSDVEYSAPTGGLIIDNLLTTPTGASNIYFQTLDTAGTSPCTGICAVQASQAAP